MLTIFVVTTAIVYILDNFATVATIVGKTKDEKLKFKSLCVSGLRFRRHLRIIYTCYRCSINILKYLVVLRHP